MSQGQRRVLVVEDDQPVRELEVAILQQAGYDVDQAADGAIAIERLKAQPPDLILLDLVMPNVDGWGVLEFVRTMPSAPPVLVVSGMHEIVPPGHLSEYVSGYVFKPFDVTKLVRTCQTALSSPPRVPAEGSRKEPRRTFIVETTLLSEAGLPLVKGQLLQLSRGGFRLELAIPLNEGDPLRVTFRVPGREEPLTLKGRVRWRNHATLGAEIDEIAPEDETVLRAIVSPE
jgi:two-component system response regulator VanR